MHSEVSVKLAANQEYRFDLEGAEPMAHEAGRRWLDDQFIALDCEPLRASGKVLLADKVLTVARAAGVALMQDPPGPATLRVPPAPHWPSPSCGWTCRAWRSRSERHLIKIGCWRWWNMR